MRKEKNIYFIKVGICNVKARGIFIKFSIKKELLPLIFVLNQV